MVKLSSVPAEDVSYLMRISFNTLDVVSLEAHGWWSIPILGQQLCIFVKRYSRFVRFLSFSLLFPLWTVVSPGRSVHNRPFYSRTHFHPTTLKITVLSQVNRWQVERSIHLFWQDLSGQWNRSRSFQEMGPSESYTIMPTYFMLLPTRNQNNAP